MQARKHERTHVPHAAQRSAAHRKATRRNAPRVHTDMRNRIRHSVGSLNATLPKYSCQSITQSRWERERLEPRAPRFCVEDMPLGTEPPREEERLAVAADTLPARREALGMGGKGGVVGDAGAEGCTVAREEQRCMEKKVRGFREGVVRMVGAVAFVGVAGAASAAALCWLAAIRSPWARPKLEESGVRNDERTERPEGVAAGDGEAEGDRLREPRASKCGRGGPLCEREGNKPGMSTNTRSSSPPMGALSLTRANSRSLRASCARMPCVAIEASKPSGARPIGPGSGSGSGCGSPHS